MQLKQGRHIFICNITIQCVCDLEVPFATWVSSVRCHILFILHELQLVSETDIYMWSLKCRGMPSCFIHKAIFISMWMYQYVQGNSITSTKPLATEFIQCMLKENSHSSKYCSWWLHWELCWLYWRCTLYKQSLIPSTFSFHNGHMLKFPVNMTYRYTTHETY